MKKNKELKEQIDFFNCILGPNPLPLLFWEKPRLSKNHQQPISSLRSSIILATKASSNQVRKITRFKKLHNLFSYH